MAHYGQDIGDEGTNEYSLVLALLEAAILTSRLCPTQ